MAGRKKTTMMRIGLTYTGTDWKQENYVRWLQDGEDIEVIKLAHEDGEFPECDALVLSGGVDIHPEFYGGALEYRENRGWNRRRDEFEVEVLKAAWGRGLPVLGVCRGLQLINVVKGGTLVQDLGVLGDEVHQNVPEDKLHGVVLDGDGLLKGIVGKSEGIVNSAHHQAIGMLGEGLRINCRAEDGTIEGIEWARPAGRSFLLAVQWHPERMYVHGLPEASFYRAIRDKFINEIKKNHGDH
jgi:putative glutamine amidotransferase